VPCSESLDILSSSAREIFAPKGLENSAQGFNQVSTLGTDHLERRALKGRQIERTNEAEVGRGSSGTLCLATLSRDKTIGPAKRLALSQRLWVETLG
jgi:hypothetical protein